MLSLVDALESEGNPEGARAALGRFETLFTNEPEYWKERASVDEHMGNLDGALISLREVDRRFAGFVEVGQEPELLWSMDRPDEALTLARQQAQTAAPSAVPFWKLFGDLAWSMEADADAETAYQHVWAAGAGNAEIAERLATLLAASGRIDELARLAAEAFQKFGAASVLLTGMDAAIEAERWDTARTLARIAAPRRAELADEPGYWSAARPPRRARRKADRGGRRVREGGGAGAKRRRARRGPARGAHRGGPRPRSRRSGGRA